MAQQLRIHRLIVKDKSFLDKSDIAWEILAYLAEHPDAQDTIDGIIEWWLLESKIKYQIAAVGKALSELVKNGFVLEERAGDSQTRYQINRQKMDDIRIFLDQSEGG